MIQAVLVGEDYLNGVDPIIMTVVGNCLGHRSKSVAVEHMHLFFIYS